jgi:Txe/YoeB family toxin of toxin-antitoxin system
VSWRIVFTPQALEDARKIAGTGLKPKVEKLLSIIGENPFKTPPKFEKLRGDLSGTFSRRINIKHRLVYQVYYQEKVVKIIRMWSHYE